MLAHHCYSVFPGNSNPTRAFSFMHLHEYVDGLVQDCSNSIANALELVLPCANPSMCTVVTRAICLLARPLGLVICMVISNETVHWRATVSMVSVLINHCYCGYHSPEKIAAVGDFLEANHHSSIIHPITPHKETLKWIFISRHLLHYVLSIHNT